MLWRWSVLLGIRELPARPINLSVMSLKYMVDLMFGLPASRVANLGFCDAETLIFPEK